MGLGRATIPAEFYDVTSKTLLRSPLPTYLHANLILTATGAKLDSDRGLYLPMTGREIPAVGAPYAQLSDQQLALSEAIATDAIMVVPDFQPGSETPGHTIRMNRPKFASTTYTMASREVPAGSTISQVPVNVGSEQVQVVVKRWAGPYDSAASRVAPFSLSRFDSSRSLHSMVQILGLQFQQDFYNTVDSFGVALFDSVDPANVIYGGTMTADNDAAVVGDSPFTFSLVLRTERRMDEAHIPYFGTTRRRIMVISPYQAEQLKGDPDYQRASSFHQEINMIYSGTYVGSAGNFDILKSATLSKPANGSSIPIHYAQAFGPGMVGVGPAGMPRVTPHTNDNYGEDTLAVWLWYCALNVLDARFGYSIRTS